MIFKSGRNKGKPYLKPVGYYGTFDKLLKELHNTKIRKSDATSFEELAKDVKCIKEELKELSKKFREV